MRLQEILGASLGASVWKLGTLLGESEWKFGASLGGSLCVFIKTWASMQKLEALCENQGLLLGQFIKETKLKKNNSKIIK